MASYSRPRPDLEMSIPAALRILPRTCPHVECNSRDVEMRYFNNGKFNQPRFFCNSCKQFFTLGGKLRDKYQTTKMKTKKFKKNERFISLQVDLTESNLQVDLTESSLQVDLTKSSKSSGMTKWMTKKKRSNKLVVSQVAQATSSKTNLTDEEDGEDEDDAESEELIQSDKEESKGKKLVQSDEDANEDKEVIQGGEDDGDNEGGSEESIQNDGDNGEDEEDNKESIQSDEDEGESVKATGSNKNDGEDEELVQIDVQDGSEDEESIQSDEDSSKEEESIQIDEDDNEDTTHEDEDEEWNKAQKADLAQGDEECIQKNEAQESIESIPILVDANDCEEVNHGIILKTELINKAKKHLMSARITLEEVYLEIMAMELELENKKLEHLRKQKNREKYVDEEIIHNLKTKVVQIVHSWIVEPLTTTKYNLLVSRKAKLEKVTQDVETMYSEVEEMVVERFSHKTMMKIEKKAKRLWNRVQTLVD